MLTFHSVVSGKDFQYFPILQVLFDCRLYTQYQPTSDSSSIKILLSKKKKRMNRKKNNKIKIDFFVKNNMYVPHQTEIELLLLYTTPRGKVEELTIKKKKKKNHPAYGNQQKCSLFMFLTVFLDFH